jgi:hypothetical protein
LFEGGFDPANDLPGQCLNLGEPTLAEVFSEALFSLCSYILICSRILLSTEEEKVAEIMVHQTDKKH